MTDTFGALAALRDSVGAERDALFARFEARWRDEPLVLDKWFALEAQSQRTDALARVRALLAHPRFNARNPNRVRSLVGGVRAAQLRALQRRATARGYAFAAEQVRGARRDQSAARGRHRRRVQPVEALRASRAAASCRRHCSASRRCRACRPTSPRW